MTLERGTDQLRCAYATPSASAIAQFTSDRFSFGAVSSCRLLQRGFNDLYVVEADGRSAVLRLSRAGRRRASDLEYEASLLAHLRTRGVPVIAPQCGNDGQYCQSANAPEGTRFALLFDFIAGREPEETPADAYAQGAVLARVHAQAAEFAVHHDRFILDLEHLLDRPLAALCALLGDRFEVRSYLMDLAGRLHQLISGRASALSWGVCHGDCHGFNARFGPDGDATLYDFDDGGPGWRAYDLAVFLWRARAFAPSSRYLWQPFLDGYRSQNPIARPDLDAVVVFVPIRHIWLMGEYAIGSTGWGHAMAGSMVRSPNRISKELGSGATGRPARDGLNCHVMPRLRAARPAASNQWLAIAGRSVLMEKRTLTFASLR